MGFENYQPRTKHEQDQLVLQKYLKKRKQENCKGVFVFYNV